MTYFLEESVSRVLNHYQYKVTEYLNIIVYFKLSRRVLSLIHTVHLLDAVRFFLLAVH